MGLAASSAACAKPDYEIRIVCPTMVEYSVSDQAEAKREYDKLKELGTAPTVITFIDDYGTLRNKIRACMGRGDGQ